MKIKRLGLKQFKRFTDLEITDIPETAKLVLVVGPNGSGKSSLFDAFIHWQRQGAGWGMDNDKLYYQKGGNTAEGRYDTVFVETYANQQPLKNSLYIRTAYRHDPDFSIANLQRLDAPDAQLRVARANQHDQTVSQNTSA